MSNNEHYKPAYRNFWYPFISGYKITSRYFWTNLFSYHNISRFFKIRYNLIMGRHINYDIYEYHYANAYRQWEIFKEYREHHNGHIGMICPACKAMAKDCFESPEDCTCAETFNDMLDKIILAWESRLKFLNDFEYRHEYEVDGHYNHELYLKWKEPLDKAWQEGMALYIEYYDGFWD